MWTWWKSRCSKAPGKKPRPRRRRSCRLNLEGLEDRTTPAPIGATPDASASDPSAITPQTFPPVIVNSLDQSALQLQAANTFGLSGGPFFANWQMLLLQSPGLNTSVADGLPRLQFFPAFLPNLFQLVELPTPEQLSTTRDHTRPVIVSLVPTTLRSPLSAFTMPSSGSVLPGESLNNGVPNSVAVPGTPLTGGPLIFRASPSGTNAVAAITGVVYRDLNDSGARDPREPGLPGVRVILEVQKGDAFRMISATMTDRAGNYAFPGLPIGNYRVRIETPPGFRTSTEGHAVTLLPHGRPGTQDFGLVPKNQRRNQPVPEDSQSKADPGLLDQVFASWGGAPVAEAALLDQVFAAPQPQTPPPVLEQAPTAWSAEEDAFAEAGMLVGAAAAVAEFDLFPGRRSWEEERRWDEPTT